MTGAGSRRRRVSVLAVAVLLMAGARVQGQEFHLFPASGPGPRFDAPADVIGTDDTIEQPFRLSPASLASGGFAPDSDAASDSTASMAVLDEPTAAPKIRRCVLFQCATLPIAPAPKLFTTGVTIWTAVGLLGGFADGIEGPAHYGFHPFTFTDESYFQRWTYGGGSDKASHFVVSTHVAGLAYDAYRLNGLSEDQAFGLAFATSVVAGAFVEIGDGLSPYGFSAQDWTADALGSLASVFIKRAGLDDTLGFSLGRWLQTTIPPAVIGGRPLFGIDYSQEIYTMNVRFAGLLPRMHAQPGFARFFQFSFAYLTKGFGYQPPLDSRYQEIGFEVGLDFQEILKAVGVSNQTWWGDTLLRIFSFLRIPFTQVGTYYNLFNHKWYGPGAPYSFY